MSQLWNTAEEKGDTKVKKKIVYQENLVLHPRYPELEEGQLRAKKDVEKERPQIEETTVISFSSEDNKKVKRREFRGQFGKASVGTLRDGRVEMDEKKGSEQVKLDCLTCQHDVNLALLQEALPVEMKKSVECQEVRNKQILLEEPWEQKIYSIMLHKFLCELWVLVSKIEERKIDGDEKKGGVMTSESKPVEHATLIMCTTDVQYVLQSVNQRYHVDGIVKMEVRINKSQIIHMCHVIREKEKLEFKFMNQLSLTDEKKKMCSELEEHAWQSKFQKLQSVFKIFHLLLLLKAIGHVAMLIPNSKKENHRPYTISDKKKKIEVMAYKFHVIENKKGIGEHQVVKVNGAQPEIQPDGVQWHNYEAALLPKVYYIMQTKGSCQLLNMKHGDKEGREGHLGVPYNTQKDKEVKLRVKTKGIEEKSRKERWNAIKEWKKGSVAFVFHWFYIMVLEGRAKFQKVETRGLHFEIHTGIQPEALNVPVYIAIHSIHTTPRVYPAVASIKHQNWFIFEEMKYEGRDKGGRTDLNDEVYESSIEPMWCMLCAHNRSKMQEENGTRVTICLGLSLGIKEDKRRMKLNVALIKRSRWCNICTTQFFSRWAQLNRKSYLRNHEVMVVKKKQLILEDKNFSKGDGLSRSNIIRLILGCCLGPNLIEVEVNKLNWATIVIMKEGHRLIGSLGDGNAAMSCWFVASEDKEKKASKAISELIA